MDFLEFPQPPLKTHLPLFLMLGTHRILKSVDKRKLQPKFQERTIFFPFFGEFMTLLIELV